MEYILPKKLTFSYNWHCANFFSFAKKSYKKGLVQIKVIP